MQMGPEAGQERARIRRYRLAPREYLGRAPGVRECAATARRLHVLMWIRSRIPCGAVLVIYYTAFAVAVRASSLLTREFFLLWRIQKEKTDLLSSLVQRLICLRSYKAKMRFKAFCDTHNFLL